MSDGLSTPEALQAELGELRSRLHHLEQDRERVERTLRERTEMLQALIHAAPVAIDMLDPQGNVLLWNPAAERLFGWTAEEVLGRPLPMVPDDKQAEFRCGLRELREGGAALVEVETRRQRKDGTPIDISLSTGAVRNEQGQVIGVLGVIRDLTRRKGLEESLRRYGERLSTLHAIDQAILLARSPEAIAGGALGHLRRLVPCQRASVVLFDPDRREMSILVVDVEGPTRLGAGTVIPLSDFARAEVLLHQEVLQFPDLDALPERSPFLEQLRREGIRRYASVPMVVEGKLIGALNLSSRELVPFTVEHLSVAREVADQLAIAIEQARLHQEVERRAREQEERVAQRTTQLQAANQELEAFAYSVSHDLRAPLRAISGFAQIIARRHRASLNEEGRHYFENIIEAGERMGRLIDDLLAYSRLGRRPVEPRPVSLREVLAPILKDLARQIQEARADIAVAEDLPEVRGDATLLGQVFANLLTNALTYRRRDVPPRITLAARADHDHVLVRVADNGIGIPAEHHDKIFRVFQRLHGDDEYPGTGIGLAIVRKAVDLLGGRVWVESTVGEGSVFCVQLPAVVSPLVGAGA